VNKRLLQMSRRIRDEFDELARVIDRAQEGWRRAQRSSDDLYLDGVALNLHGFYAGLERLFEELCLGKGKRKGFGSPRRTYIHLRARMHQRGITREEIERTLNEGREASDAKSGTLGRVMVFPYETEWERQFYQEKEVTVYYKVTDEGLILLTVKARYGQGFPRG